jgi:hypothetical protein
MFIWSLLNDGDAPIGASGMNAAGRTSAARISKKTGSHVRVVRLDQIIAAASKMRAAIAPHGSEM